MVAVAAPVPEQCAAWPMYVSSPSEKTKFAVHWAPSVNGLDARMDLRPSPAADAAVGASAMAASAHAPARSSSDIPAAFG